MKPQRYMLWCDNGSGFAQYFSSFKDATDEAEAGVLHDIAYGNLTLAYEVYDLESIVDNNPADLSVDDDAPVEFDFFKTKPIYRTEVSEKLILTLKGIINTLKQRVEREDISELSSLLAEAKRLLKMLVELTVTFSADREDMQYLAPIVKMIDSEIDNYYSQLAKSHKHS